MEHGNNFLVNRGHNKIQNLKIFIKRQTSDTLSDNEWQRVTTSDNEGYKELERLILFELNSEVQCDLQKFKKL